MRLLFLSAVALLFVGCHRAPLQCRTEALYPDYLASTNVGTPDPCNACFLGQQVVMQWNVPHPCLPLELVLHVRYGSREDAIFSWPITRSRGHHIYRLINDEYWCREGIVSFKAVLYQDGEPLYDWKHSLWVDLIQI